MKYALLLLILSILLSCDYDTAVDISELEEPVAFTGYSGERRTYMSYERELMLIDLQDGKLIQLTSNWAQDQVSSWSPSGSHILFLSTRSIGWEAAFPFPTNSKFTRMFLYNLKNGKTHHIDISWAKKDSLYDPGVIQSMDWLKAADWNPVDSTKVAVSVKHSPSFESKKNYRIAVLDLKDKDFRVLKSHEEASFELMWSPNGKYIARSVGGKPSVEVINASTGRGEYIRGSHTIKGNPLVYYFDDWGRDGNSILVRGYSISSNSDSTYIYNYNIYSKAWSKIAGFDGKVEESQYTQEKVNDKSDVLIVLKENLSEESIFLYDISSGNLNRVSKELYPKKFIRVLRP